MILSRRFASAPVRSVSLSAALLLFLSPAFSPLRAQSTQTPAALPQPGQLTTSPASANGNDMVGYADTMSAPPLTVGEKFHLRVIESFGWRGLGGGLLSAGISQATGTPYAWGGGAEGFGKRYASSLGGNVARQTFSFVLESALHEDPHYFPSTDKRFFSRAGNVVKQVFVTKTDTNHTTFAYGRFGSAIAAGQFVNIWQPASNGGVSDGFQRALFSLCGDFGYFALQEFVPFTRPKAFRHP